MRYLSVLLLLLWATVAQAQPPSAPGTPRIPADSADRKTLTVTVTGSGTVSGPGLSSCAVSSGDCTENIVVNTTTTIFANPASGSTFAGWSGDCSGVSICTVTMSAAKNVTAIFTTSAATNGTVYYVHPTGTNPSCATVAANGASSLTQRKSTIAAGLACLAAAGGGNTLVIGAGTYNENIPEDSIPSGSGPGGEAREALWPGATIVMAETPCSLVGTSLTPTCQTVIRPSAGNCTGAGNAAVIRLHQFSQRRYIIFRGFEADANNTCQQVFNLASQESVTRPDHIRIQQVYAHDAVGNPGGTGLIGPVSHVVGGNATYIEVLDSTIKNLNVAGCCPTAGGNHCLYFNASGTIRRNRIHNCSPTDKNGEGIATHSPETQVTVDISGNDVSGFGFSGIAAEVVVNSNVYNNVVHDGGGTDAQCSTVTVPCTGIQVGYGNATNTLVANNTVYNISAGNGGASIYRDGSTTTNTVIQNNIVNLGTNATITAAGDGGSNSNNRCNGGCTTSDGPAFADAPGGDFRLTASTPSTITQGGLNLSGTFTTDKAEVTRTVPWSMGAYER